MRKGDKMSFCQVFVNVGHSGHAPVETNPRNTQSFQHGRSIGCVKRTGRAFGFISQEKNSDLYFSVDDVIEVYPLKVGEVFTFGFSWACCARWGSTRFLHSYLIGRAAHAGFLR